MTYNVEELKTEAVMLVQSNSIPTIATQADFAKAGDVLKLVKNRVAAIEAKRKSYTDPLLKQQRLIKADFDQAAEPFVNFIAELEIKMKAFWAQEKIRVDQLQLGLDIEAAKSAGVDGQLVPIVNDIKTTRGDIASTTMRMVTKWRLIDITAVPSKFLTVDEKLMNAHVKDGGKCPSGIEYFQEQVLSSR
jgi:hypothetical protein